MNRYMIFVEGKADACFLRDYLKFLYSNLEITKDNKTEKELKNNESIVRIIVTAGCDKIRENFRVKFEEINDYNYKILVIQDADDMRKNKNTGGVTLRTLFLENLKKELNVNFDFFLFPNNEDDGDLETLLLKIVNNEYFTKTKDCYFQWIECAKEHSPSENIEELKLPKNIVYNYFRTFHGMKKANEENRDYSDEYWRFSSKSLEPLKKFLEKNIIK